jgi:glutathione synthase/RimK-type ligase-like ATP-grasp enzyme
VHNVAQGGRGTPQAPTPAIAQVAEQAARALEMDYAGVDLIPDGDGFSVLEVNGVAAWRALQKVTPWPIARALVDDLFDRKWRGARARRRA